MALDRPAAAHLLRRAGMGGTNPQIADFFGLTRAEAVDRVLDTSSNPPLPNWSQFGGLEDWQAQEAIIEWWVDRMISAPPTIEEKLMLFLHSHFATARDKVEDTRLMWNQHVALRQFGMGSFRTLLEKISFGSAMLIYLDNESNVAGAEQENFARELMELHTIGHGRFEESDVVSMARAWTGHNTVGRTRENNWQYDPAYIFRSEEHDHGQKTLFGITRNWDAKETLDELCFGVKANEMSDFVARKVFQFFAHTNPAQSVVDQLAANFRANNLNMKLLVRDVLLTDDFWSPEARYALVKSPVEFMVDIMRRCGMTSEDESVRWRMSLMGMVLMDPPGVDGWGQNDYWLSTAMTWAKSNWTNNLKWRADDRNILQDLADLTPDEAADRVIHFFSIYDVSRQSRLQIRDLIEVTQRDRRWAMSYEPFAVGMFMPEVQCA
ncbi:MAG: DUF1800 family protein [Acidimicrobiales bacterium]|nr:DUF1800 domain-containing protein [Acidimicrobiia bacterium]NNC79475.1 DUF1800 family protein [Acidimicrobiales bacterium]RZV46478.1 MAG: DUF1800 family protein [Acidimicrobiales bacterium]